MKKLTVLTGSERTQPKVSQGKNYPPTGLLSLIFSSVKVTVSDSAGVTVSMTSEDSAGYGKCDSDSHLNSPKSASAKSRQRRSATQGLCAYNHLNKKENPGFVQTTGKEKEPHPALRVMQLLTCEEANKLHHNSYLQASRFAQCQQPSQALGSMPRDCNSLRPRVLNQLPKLIPDSSAAASNCSFSSRGILSWNVGAFPSLEVFLSRLIVDMYVPTGLGLNLMGTYLSMVKPVSNPPLKGVTSTKRGLTKPLVGVTVMAEHQHTQTRPEFLETYWIIPEYSTAPYGKVSLTRQDRRTFNSLFKDSRLIWAGRQPVKYCTQGLKDPKSPKVGVKHTMSHEGIEETSIPQGMVKITPPLTITEIVTVQGEAHA